ncbi:hypothetical protein HMPREF1531_02153 [Propionibacterium sp. oral taxon 192 str. F0372]|uniref:ABC transporter ATP-binding protein n=1 Tax=Propionibacterium sp. oral taxon 192 TaxID=671222 RepID=UPI00035478E3|nr:hypothetical protein HMPREF1531_02153 [Propionibacterium sp. oral taxon 192 str. F0372]
MIEFESVSKIYPSGAIAVEEFSLLIPSHSVCTLVGSSGCGKTTLLRMVNRMVTPSSGRVLIDSEDIAAADAVELRRSIGYVLQSGGLLPHRTILDNVITVPVLKGRKGSATRAHGLELLELVGLDPAIATRYPAQLSGGQQQRVGVARALAADPNILLMDEPFGAVDPIIRRELQTELTRLQTELGKTIVFVTHDIDEAFRLGDQVVVLRSGGHIAQQGTPEEITSAPADSFVSDFVGADLGGRRLHAITESDRTVIVDADGKPLGVLR